MRIIILILLAGMVLTYDLQCPDRSQRQLRSRGLCVGNSTYTCLEDVNMHTFIESCSEEEDSVRPGRKYVYKGQTTDIECSKHRYQPIKFYKTSSAVCLFLKSPCAEVGQIVGRNDSKINDTTCICDYKEGYAYVTRPADVCSCVPSREDCTCYEKMCPKDHILSADSKCIFRNTPNMTECATVDKSRKYATTTVRTDFTGLTIFICRFTGYCVKAKCDDINQDTSLSLEEVTKQTEERSFKDENKRNDIGQKITAQRKNCKCHDSHENFIKEWGEQDKVFVKTRVVDVILKKLETNHCITVTGKPGMGKSAIIHHIALLLNRRKGYTIVPCTNPRDIKDHYKKDDRQVFVFDDVCGKYTAIQNDVDEWRKEEQNIILNSSDQKTKILSSCRLQVFSEKQFQNINLFKGCNIDLTSNKHSLTTEEKIDIALKYLDKDIVESCKDILEMSDFLPLTCFLCKQKSPGNVKDFLSDPFHFYTDELNQMKNESNGTKWCALFLCILHGGKIEESYFGHVHDLKRQELEIILDHCSRNKATSIMHVKEHLESLVGTYIKTTRTFVNFSETFELTFTIIHDKMFDFLCHYFGSNQQNIFIRHAKTSLLAQRTQLESLNEDYDQFKVIISQKNEAEYFKRISEVCKNGDYVGVLCYNQMKFKKFREMLINKINETKEVHLSMSGQELESALNTVCRAGYHDMFCFLLEQQSGIDPDKVLQCACFGGNVDIVRHLIKMGAQVNAITPKASCNLLTSSPLVEACKCCNKSIVSLLIENGANVNQIVDERSSPLIAACESGNESIVTLLIENKADVNLTSKVYSPLIRACGCGNQPVVALLINKGADVNLTACDISPLISACRGGHLPIVQLLIDARANVNNTTNMFSPLISACASGNEEIVKLLINNGADVNKTALNGNSPLVYAVAARNDSIFTLLTDSGAVN